MNSRNPVGYLFSKTWQYSAGNRRTVALFWGMFVVANGINLLGQPLLLAKIMNLIQEDGITENNIFLLLGLLVSILLFDVVFWAIHGPARVLEMLNAFKVRANYEKSLLQVVMTLPLGWHTNHHSGDTYDKVAKGTRALYDFSEEAFQIIYALVQLVVSYVMLSYFSPPSAGIVIVMIGLTAWTIIRFDRSLIGQYHQLNRAENNIAESILDAITNITTVIILRVEKLVFGSIVHKIDNPFTLFKQNTILSETKWFLVSMLCAVTTVLVVGAYLWQNVGTDQGVLVGSLYILIRYMERLNDLSFQFAGLYSNIVKQKTRVMNSEELAEDFLGESFNNHVLPTNWKRLTVEGLNFSYEGGDGESPHLDDVSLGINRGEKIAFVGPSGSGKTTLLKVIRYLYTPQELVLLVDGQEIPQGFDGISRAIALIPQNPEIFATTILENITLGAEYPEELIWKVIEMACATEVIAGLPKGLDSSIKEKGVNLSGGQQQRIALARGLLACPDKEVVLLDEPTSSLDTVNERKAYENIFREFADKTVISSIHRLHLLTLFDRICVFKDGRIICQGSLEEVLRDCPEFASSWEQYHQV